MSPVVQVPALGLIQLKLFIDNTDKQIKSTASKFADGLSLEWAAHTAEGRLSLKMVLVDWKMDRKCLVHGR